MAIPAGLLKYAKLARAAGADVAKVIPARYVVTAEWVRLKCQFGCSGYNKRLCCPPYSPTPETTRKMLREYRWALIFAYAGDEGRKERKRTHRSLAGMERAAFLDGHYKAFGFGSGPCRFCPKCDTTKRCRFPELVRPSMESSGIDVYATCRNSGIKLEVVTSYEQTPRYVNLLLIE
jgi:predicted metal-binding protein